MFDPWQAPFEEQTVDLSTLPSSKERDALLLKHGIDFYDVKPEQVRRQFGTWAVTDYGLECLADEYAIEKKRLRENDWLDHMAGKTWVDMRDFLAAYRYATGTGNRKRRPRQHQVPAVRQSQGRSIPLTLRFAVLKRDGYRCQLCGKTATDGVQLEVDHKKPHSKGGEDTEDNLWTTCFECNRGKGDKDV